ncbi:MAG: preprotein translocase subunit SecE [Arsenophonus sp.]
MSMNSDTQKNRRSFDVAKWIFVIILLIISIVGNYYFRHYNGAWRVMVIILTIAFAVGISLWTEKGKSTLSFSRKAYIEIRKVIWPTHQETLQTTLIVTLVTAVMALILWGLDGILVRLVSFFTELRL